MFHSNEPFLIKVSHLEISNKFGFCHHRKHISLALIIFICYFFFLSLSFFFLRSSGCRCVWCCFLVDLYCMHVFVCRLLHTNIHVRIVFIVYFSCFSWESFTFAISYFFWNEWILSHTATLPFGMLQRWEKKEKNCDKNQMQ